MDCFCSIYNCPTYSHFSRTCSGEPSDSDVSYWFATAAQADACGQVWFSTGEFAGPRYAYAVDSGVLIGATASYDGPVTAPCGTYTVSAGAALDCPETARCDCGPEDSITESCDAEWFGALAP